MADFNFRSDTPPNEQTPEGILRAILAEVRGLREDLAAVSKAGEGFITFTQLAAGKERALKGAADT